MGPKYHNEYYDLFGNLHRWEIWDKLLTPSSQSFEVESYDDGFTLERGQAGDKVYEPIIRTTGTVKWRLFSTNELNYLQAIAQDQEDRFFIKYYKKSNLEWQGNIVVDLIRIPNQPIEQGLEVQLVARDGLQRLKENTSPLTYVSALNLIFKMLRNVDTGPLFANTDPFIRTAIRWFEESMAYGTTQNPFARWTVNPDNTFKDPDKTEFYDHYTCLERMLLAFSAQLEMSGGSWLITNHSEKADGTIREHIYQRNYSPGGNDFQNESGIISAGVMDYLPTTEGNPVFVEFLGPQCSYTYRPKLKKAEREIKYDGGTRLWSRTNYVTTTQFMTASITELPSQDSFIRVVGNFYVKARSGVVANVYREYTVTLKLVGTNTWYYSTNSGWGTTAVTSKVITSSTQMQLNMDMFFNDAVNIDTGNIPGSGTLFVEVDLAFVSQNGNGQIPQLITIDIFKATEIFVEHLPEDITRLRDTVIYAKDPSSQSSAVEVLPDAYITDGRGTTNNTKIQIWTGSQWQDSVAWRLENAGTRRNIVAFQLEELLRLYSVPRELHTVQMNGSLSSHEMILWDSKYFAFTHYVYKTGEGHISGEIHELARITTDFTVGEITDIPQQVMAAKIAGQSMQYSLPPGLALTFTTASIAAGTLDAVDVQSLGFDGPVDGQKLIIVNMATMDAEEIELSADLNSTDTSISFNSVAFSANYPAGSLIMIQAQELSNLLARRSSGFLCGLALSASRIGSSQDALELDTASGDGRFNGQLSVPNIQESSEAATGELYVDGEGFIKLKEAP